MVYEKNRNFVLRKVHDTYFFIDICDNYKSDKCSLIETNQIGMFIWEHLDQKTTAETITNELLDAITDDIPYETVYQDVKQYLDILTNSNVVKREG